MLLNIFISNIYLKGLPTFIPILSQSINITPNNLNAHIDIHSWGRLSLNIQIAVMLKKIKHAEGVR